VGNRSEPGKPPPFLSLRPGAPSPVVSQVPGPLALGPPERGPGLTRRGRAANLTQQMGGFRKGGDESEPGPPRQMFPVRPQAAGGRVPVRNRCWPSLPTRKRRRQALFSRRDIRFLKPRGPDRPHPWALNPNGPIPTGQIPAVVGWERNFPKAESPFQGRGPRFPPAGGPEVRTKGFRGSEEPPGRAGPTIESNGPFEGPWDRAGPRRDPRGRSRGGRIPGPPGAEDPSRAFVFRAPRKIPPRFPRGPEVFRPGPYRSPGPAEAPTGAVPANPPKRANGNGPASKPWAFGAGPRARGIRAGGPGDGGVFPGPRPAPATHQNIRPPPRGLGGPGVFPPKTNRARGRVGGAGFRPSRRGRGGGTLGKPWEPRTLDSEGPESTGKGRNRKRPIIPPVPNPCFGANPVREHGEPGPGWGRFRRAQGMKALAWWNRRTLRARRFPANGLRGNRWGPGRGPAMGTGVPVSAQMGPVFQAF